MNRGTILKWAQFISMFFNWIFVWYLVFYISNYYTLRHRQLTMENQTVLWCWLPFFSLFSYHARKFLTHTNTKCEWISAKVLHSTLAVWSSHRKSTNISNKSLTYHFNKKWFNELELLFAVAINCSEKFNTSLTWIDRLSILHTHLIDSMFETVIEMVFSSILSNDLLSYLNSFTFD